MYQLSMIETIAIASADGVDHRDQARLRHVDLFAGGRDGAECLGSLMSRVDGGRRRR